MGDPHTRMSRAREGDARRCGGETERRPGRARARRGGREHERDQGEAGRASHRPITVNVTVAVYLPAGTTGSGETNPTRVSHTSPAAALRAVVVPTSRSA